MSDNPYGTTDLKSLPRERLPQRTPAKRSSSKNAERKETRDVSGFKIKKAVLLLESDAGHARKIEAELLEMDIGVSLVAISNVRTQFLECVKLLNEEGLIDKRALIEFRKEHA